MSPEIHPSAAVGFERAAGAYERGRPDFPDAAVAALDASPRPAARPDRPRPRRRDRQADPAARAERARRSSASSPSPRCAGPCASSCPTPRSSTRPREALPLAPGAADAAVAAQAFHWFDGPRALAELARVLPPGGPLALDLERPRRGRAVGAGDHRADRAVPGRHAEPPVDAVARRVRRRARGGPRRRGRRSPTSTGRRRAAAVDRVTVDQLHRGARATGSASGSAMPCARCCRPATRSTSPTAPTCGSAAGASRRVRDDREAHPVRQPRGPRRIGLAAAHSTSRSRISRTPVHPAVAHRLEERAGRAGARERRRPARSLVRVRGVVVVRSSPSRASPRARGRRRAAGDGPVAAPRPLEQDQARRRAG